MQHTAAQELGTWKTWACETAEGSKTLPPTQACQFLFRKGSPGQERPLGSWALAELGPRWTPSKEFIARGSPWKHRALNSTGGLVPCGGAGAAQPQNGVVALTSLSLSPPGDASKPQSTWEAVCMPRALLLGPLGPPLPSLTCVPPIPCACDS